MKTCSIFALSATAMLLACAWPASAATPDGGAAPRVQSTRGDRPDRAVSTHQTHSPAKSKAAGGDADASANATASSEGGIGVGSQGQSITLDSHARASASTAIAPALTGSNDTCMGSTSMGAAALAFGLSFGTTYTDDNCMMLKNARELWNMGFRGAAIARMCMDERNRQALDATGVPCPTLVSEREKRDAPEASPRENSLRGAVSLSAQPARFTR